MKVMIDLISLKSPNNEKQRSVDGSINHLNKNNEGFLEASCVLLNNSNNFLCSIREMIRIKIIKYYLYFIYFNRLFILIKIRVF